MSNMDIDLEVLTALEQLSIQKSTLRSPSPEDTIPRIKDHSTSQSFPVIDCSSSEYSKSSADSYLDQNQVVQPYPKIGRAVSERKRQIRLPQLSCCSDEDKANNSPSHAVFDNFTSPVAEHGPKRSPSKISVSPINQLPFKQTQEPLMGPELSESSCLGNHVMPASSSSKTQTGTSASPDDTFQEIHQDITPGYDDQLELSSRPQDGHHNRGLSCPFTKYNPPRYYLVYKSCTDRPGFPNPGKLVEHLKRVHSSQHGCPTCRKRFSGTDKSVQEARTKHLSINNCVSRELTVHEPEWMNSHQELLLSSSIIRSRECAEDKWRSIYCFLFQVPKEETSTIPSPWYDFLIVSHCRDQVAMALLNLQPMNDREISNVPSIMTADAKSTRPCDPEPSFNQPSLANTAIIQPNIVMTDVEETSQTKRFDTLSYTWSVPKLVDSAYESVVYDHDHDESKDMEDAERGISGSQSENETIVQEFDLDWFDNAQPYSPDNSQSMLIGAGNWMNEPYSGEEVIFMEDKND